MHIIMTSTQKGSVDGTTVAEYVEGQQYDLTATKGERELAAAFVDAGMAREVALLPVIDTSPAPSKPSRRKAAA